jgi:branched-chain amino acid transport system permease protein
MNETHPLRPTNSALRTFSPARSRERRLAVVSAIAGLALLSVPVWGDSFLLRIMAEFMSLLALAQMWNLLAGYAGMVSVGQQAWIGLGGYALIVLADDLKVNVFLAVFLAGIVTLVLSVPTAWLVFRLRAGYFAIGTWVISEVFHLLVKSNTAWLRGGSGRTLNAIRLIGRGPREDLTYLVALAVGVGSIVLVYFLMRSKTGLGLTAIRDSEGSARRLGVNTYRIKLLVFVICAYATGVAGALIYLYTVNIRPGAAFDVQWTAFMIFIVVIGGIGTIEGPIIGTIIFFLIRQYLSNFGEWSFILLGGIAISLMLVAPQGLWGVLRNRFDWELFPVRRLLPARLLEPQNAPPKDQEGMLPVQTDK